MEKKDDKALKSWADIELDKIIGEHLEEQRGLAKNYPDARGEVYSSRAGNNPLGNQGSTSTQAGPSSQKRRHLDQPEAVNPAPDKRARQVSNLPQEPDPNTVALLPFLPYMNIQPILEIPIPRLIGPVSNHPPQAQNRLAEALYGPSQRLWNTNPGEQMRLPMGSFQNHNWNPNPVLGMVREVLHPSVPPVNNPRPPQVQHVANRPYRKYHTRRHPRRSDK